MRERAQRGVAVGMALLVVALATSAATYILWQQSLWVRQVENLNARAQADAIARAAANWAATILAEDDPAIDHLGENWARRMPPFPAEQAQVVGGMVDEQAIYSTSGKRIPCQVDSICVHGDGPTAVAVSKAVRAGLETAGIKVVPLPELPSLKH